MEGLIIPLIIIILSSLFGRKKQDENPAPKPAPRNIQTAPQQKPVAQNPFKSLGDLAKEFQQEQQQQQARPERKQTSRKQAPRKQVVQAEVLPPVIQNTGREAGRDQGVPRSSGRLSVHQVIPTTNVTKKTLVHNIMPDTKEELMRAIVLSEILAPPKSKR